MLQKCVNILNKISVKELKASRNGEIIVSLRDLQVVCVCVCSCARTCGPMAIPRGGFILIGPPMLGCPETQKIKERL